MSTAIEPQDRIVGGVAVDYAQVLKALNLNPSDPKVQALVLTCQQYNLDPVLKHMILINQDAYVTHKGLLHVAHTSGALDGIELVDEGETGDEWWAKVSVHRKDMSRPFTYKGRYSKSATNKKHGPEMAITRAECMALRRAFDVAAPVQEEQDWPQPTVTVVPDPPAAIEASSRPPSTPLATDAERDAVNARLATLDTEMTDEAKRLWKAEVGPPFKSVERFTGDHATKALALCDAVEKEVFDRRRRHVYAVLGEIEKHTGEKIADEDRHAIVSSATNGATESTGRLSEAQLAAVLDQLAP